MGQIDIAIRHVTRSHPEDLARCLLPPGLEFEVIGWFDSQLTGLERRLDKALDLRVGGKRRLLHVEIATDLSADDAYRVHEYGGFLLKAVRDDVLQAKAKRRRRKRRAPEAAPPTCRRAPVPVHSVVILLRGRKAAWPSEGEYGVGWPELGWSGTHFRIEAVYQRTVDELCARDAVLWLVFTPLAIDATAARMRRVLGELRRRVKRREERAELETAMLMMASIDPWGHNLREEMQAMLTATEVKIIKQTPILREAWEKGEESGEKRGEKKGEKKGANKLLRTAFAEQTGRRPTPEEQVALEKRAEAEGAARALRAIMRRNGDDLVAWLLGTSTDAIR